MTKIMVSDQQKFYDFYTRIVGLKLVTSPDMPLQKIPVQGDPEKVIIEIPLNYSGSTLGFKVPDVAQAMERAGKASIQPSRPFTAAGRIGFIKDPDGYTVEFIQPPSFESRRAYFANWMTSIREPPGSRTKATRTPEVGRPSGCRWRRPWVAPPDWPYALARPLAAKRAPPRVAGSPPGAR
jgi:predicted enzyme related to lactoylglutathione lyase